MIVVNLELDGSVPWEILRKYGGRYSFFQKIKMGGVGSPKIVYQSGITAFDEIKSEPVSDACYVNFEYLKNGLLGRLNKGQKLKGFILAFEEIEAIQFRKNTSTKSGESQLILSTHGGDQLIFQVNAPILEGIQNYFRKKKEFENVLFLK